MKVLIVYHTTYGHTLQLARAIEAGVKSVAGVEAVFRRAPEFPHVEKELEAGDGFTAVSFVNPMHGWVGGPGTILATTDGGSSWSRQYAGDASIQAFSFDSLGPCGWCSVTS